MLSWLYDIFVAIVSFVMGLFGFDLKKRSVTFADDVKDSPADSAPAAAAATVVENVLAVVSETKDEAAPITESA
jgi:hypothetical protein